MNTDLMNNKSNTKNITNKKIFLFIYFFNICGSFFKKN